MQEIGINITGNEAGIKVEKGVIVATEPGKAEPGKITIREKPTGKITVLPSGIVQEAANCKVAKDVKPDPTLEIGENGGMIETVNGERVEKIPLELTNAAQLKIMITLARKRDVPSGLRKEDNPVLHKSEGEASDMYRDLKYTEGGLCIFNELRRKKGWALVDAYYVEADVKGKLRYRVYVCLKPEGTEKLFPHETFVGLVRLLSGLYAVYVYDHRLVKPQRDIFVQCVFEHLDGMPEGETKHIFVSQK